MEKIANILYLLYLQAPKNRCSCIVSKMQRLPLSLFLLLRFFCTQMFLFQLLSFYLFLCLALRLYIFTITILSFKSLLNTLKAKYAYKLKRSSFMDENEKAQSSNLKHILTFYL